MHLAVALPQFYDDALIAGVDLTAELIGDWRNPAHERHLTVPHSPEPVIYRVGRPPYTQAAGVTAAEYATQLIYRDARVTSEHALVNTAFRIGMGTGAYAMLQAMGHPLPVFPPPRETFTDWLIRLERDLANWLLTRLAVDPPPGGSAPPYQRFAQALRRRVADRAMSRAGRRPR
jgi:hypothetical protein